MSALSSAADWEAAFAGLLPALGAPAGATPLELAAHVRKSALHQAVVSRFTDRLFEQPTVVATFECLLAGAAQLFEDLPAELSLHMVRCAGKAAYSCGVVGGLCCARRQGGGIF